MMTKKLALVVVAIAVAGALGCAKDKQLNLSVADSEKGIAGTYTTGSGAEMSFTARNDADAAVATVQLDGLQVATVRVSADGVEMTIDGIDAKLALSGDAEAYGKLQAFITSARADQMREFYATLVAELSAREDLQSWVRLYGTINDVVSGEETFTEGENPEGCYGCFTFWPCNHDICCLFCSGKDT